MIAEEFDGHEPAAPVWTVFGDLMAGMVGALVLILLVALATQSDLALRLEQAVQREQAEARRREALERALAGPLAEGRVTLEGGRIGIRGSVLFETGSADLQPEGAALLRRLAGPLAAYLDARDEILMVSGHTDDRQVREGSRRFEDNWELAAQRALTVTRALVAAGVPRASVFAATFGAEQPLASNADAAGRLQNRRVEIAPMPRPGHGAAPAAAPSMPASAPRG